MANTSSSTLANKPLSQVLAKDFLPIVYGISEVDFHLKLQNALHIPAPLKKLITEAMLLMTWDEYISYVGRFRPNGSRDMPQDAMESAFYFDLAVRELGLQDTLIDPHFEEDDVFFSLDETYDFVDDFHGKIRSNGIKYK